MNLESGLGFASSAGETAFGGLGPVSSLAAVFLCGTFAFLNLYCTQPLLPLLAELFHAGKGAVGLTVSASTLGVAISAPLLGVFAERLSRKRVIVWSIVLSALPTLLAATSPSLGALIAWRFLQGLVVPGIFAITIVYITEKWPANKVALAMSIYIGGTALGGLLGRVLAGVITTWLGWRASFAVLGLLTLAGSIPVERWLVAEAAPRSSPLDPGAAWAQFCAGVAGHLRNPRLLATYWIGFNLLFSLVAIFTYVTFYLAAPPFLLSTRELSYVFTVYLIALVTTPAAGAVLPRVGLRYGIALANLLLVAGAAATLIHSVTAVVLGLTVFSCGVFIAQTCATSYIREVTPLGNRVSAIGLYVTFYYVGGTAGGIVPSYLWHWGGWAACAIFIAALDLLTIAIALIGWRTRGPKDLSLAG